MNKILLLALSFLTFTACAKEEPKIEKFVCTTKPIQPPLHIIDKPIDFGTERIVMSKAYIKQHYGKNVNDIIITPKIIVLHWTAEMSFDRSFKRLQPQRLLTDRKDIAKASLLNVSSQFMIARDGTIYRLMPENWMARHVIGLNYSSIGVENIGGKDNKAEDLTPAQLQANIALVGYLKEKYPTITYLIGHHEYRQMESTSLWLEKDKGYRTVKSDPGAKFMSDVRKAVKALKLKTPPKEKQ
jgi:beta-N-acetylhexosaminidase